MTREEELDWLCRLRSEIYVYMPKEWLIPMNDALDMAIKALSQECVEPTQKHVENALDMRCGDAISRQAVLDIINFEDKWLLDAKGHNADTEIAFSGMKSRITELPSVNPQEPKTGHCKDCKSFREIPYHSDICIQHRGLCPKGDWYCADYEPQESEE